MLGRVDAAQPWRWATHGKHPVARDYFKVGETFPLGTGFSEWVEKGYQVLASRKEYLHELYSWRFWARGSQKETILCGLLRDSSDRLGRPYPILIMGTGPVHGWENHWDLLPFACEGVWNQMESISTRMFLELRHLDDEVHRIKPPEPRWEEFDELNREQVGIGSPPGRKNGSEEIRSLENKVMALAERREFFLPIDEEPMIHLWHSLLKTHLTEIPKAVFMGGNPMKTCLALFQRPLAAQDFQGLWSVFSEGK
jgi:type VI secretion system protein VasJ